MTARANPRSYDASGRRARARESRRAVVEAARVLLEEQGYAATTIAAVARRAGVSPESVYKGFGSKAALVKEVFDVVVAGDDAPMAVAERPESDRIRETPGVRDKLRAYAEGAALRNERSARVQLAVRDGARHDAAIADLWDRVQSERLTGMRMFARHLVSTGGLRADVTEAHAADVLWSSISVELHDLLVRQRGWNRAAYADWLARSLVGALVDDSGA